MATDNINPQPSPNPWGEGIEDVAFTHTKIASIKGMEIKARILNHSHQEMKDDMKKMLEILEHGHPNPPLLGLLKRKINDYMEQFGMFLEDYIVAKVVIPYEESLKVKQNEEENEKIASDEGYCKSE